MKIAILALLLLTQAAIPKSDPPKLPTIPDKVIASFWKAQSSVQAASAQKTAAEDAFTKAQTAYAEAVKGLQEACGKEYQPQMNQTGDPICVEIPKAAAKPETKEQKK